jgi:3-methyladenine DNA glycosylase/8-oxoguanine DNA glycosylase
MPRTTHAEASAALARLDPTMARLVERHGPMRLPRPVAASRRFEQLAESIAYQQLAGRAAATIWGRFRALYGDGPLDPAEVLDTPVEALRAAGLSGSKAASLLDLARHVADGTLVLDRAGRLGDDELIAELVQVRGIGPWTAHMFLLFTLQRLDVWPVGDYGVRTGYGIAYEMAEAPTAKELEALGERFRPYRSVAAWYCWRALDSPGRSARGTDESPRQSTE